jgi:hypothetical protein
MPVAANVGKLVAFVKYMLDTPSGRGSDQPTYCRRNASVRSRASFAAAASKDAR